MTNIFQICHILQFILRAFSVILLISYMTDFFFPLSFPVSNCNIQRAQYGECYSLLSTKLQTFLRACDKHNEMHHKGFF